MGTVLQCRKFNFFDVKPRADDGRLLDSLKDTNIVSFDSSRGFIYLGDSKGSVHILSRQFQVVSFSAHQSSVNIIHTVDSSNLIISVSVLPDELSELRIWSTDRHNPQTPPACLRTIHPDPFSGNPAYKGSSNHNISPPSVTAVAVHPNNFIMAVGLSNGSLIFYRGDLRRERGIKAKLVKISNSVAVTNLNFRYHQSLSHLFVTTTNAVYCINCTSKDKEKVIELDNDGCVSGCATLTDSRHDNQLLVARDDAIYSYTPENKASCYIFDGKKVNLAAFKGYIFVASLQEANLYSDVSRMDLTIFDPSNKLITLTTVIENFLGIVYEWGSLYAVTCNLDIIHLIEKDLQSKFELLFKKNQFELAISLAKMQCCDQEEISEILKQYGDWLYSKGNFSAAMDQYIKTIPLLEPSYVIKKYLDTQLINHLTTYLQALHKMGYATSDHTTLILNCYTRLRDSKQLDDFIMNKQGEIDCDVDLGIKVCRSAGYFDHALALASKNKLHQLYLSILIEDKKDYAKALKYISTLPFNDAHENMLRYGATLLAHVTEEATDLIVLLCTKYVCLSDAKEPDMTTEEPQHSEPEDFEYVFVGQSDAYVSFLERVMKVKNLSSQMYTTLLGELLFQFSQAPEGQDRSIIGDKILKILRNDHIKLDRDHALLLCDKHQFHAGKLILWEKSGMFQELLAWHAENGEYSSIVDVCTNHSNAHPNLWVSALKLVVSETSPLANNSTFLNKILNKIEESQLLPPMELVDLLASSPHVTLGQVREFLLRVVSNQSAAVTSEAALIEQQRRETCRVKNDISSLTNGSREFTATKCNVCNNNLNLPSIHFLCRHAFHVHCFDSYAGGETDCPLCSTENRKLKEMLIAQSKNVSRHDFLQEQLERTTDTFSIVADFVGRGAFTHFQNLDTIHPSFHHAKFASSDKSKLALENTLLGPTESAIGSEGRLRLRESRSQGILSSESEGRLRQQIQRKSPVDRTTESRLRSAVPSASKTIPSEARLRSAVPSAVVVSTPEARLRAAVPESVPRQGSPSPKVHARVVSSPNLAQAASNPSTISASIHNPKKDFSEPHGSDNPFENPTESTNPFGTDFETEDIESNPFEEQYKKSKNPFSDDYADKPHAGDTHEGSNPFDVEYDPKLNPFEDDDS